MSTWRKSSHSAGPDDNCVELAQLDGTIGVRDSKHPEDGHLTLEAARFTGLAWAIKAGKYNR